MTVESRHFAVTLRERATALDSDLDIAMSHARLDGAKISNELRAASYFRFALAAALSAGAFFLGAPAGGVAAVAILAVGFANIVTVNDWAAHNRTLLIYTADQALHLHRRSLEALADSAEDALT